MKINKYLLIPFFLLMSFQASAGSDDSMVRTFHIKQAELAGLQLAVDKLENLGVARDFSVFVQRESNLIHYTFYEGELDFESRGNTSGGVMIVFHYSVNEQSLTYNYVR